jgi:ubiquitin-protein ligase
MTDTLKQRLLRDIAELQSKPYPNIELHVQDDDLTQACLVLNPQGYGLMHLTVTFPHDFPLKPPKIQVLHIYFLVYDRLKVSSRLCSYSMIELY